MIKKIAARSFFSFAVTGMTDVIIILAVSLIGADTGREAMLPEFVACFPNEMIALCVNVLLVGLIGAAFGACSVILEIEQWSLLKQGIVHFLLTSVVWMPISMFVWCLYKYPVAVISAGCSYLFSYGLTWILKTIDYRRSVSEINKNLEEIKNALSEQGHNSRND